MTNSLQQIVFNTLKQVIDPELGINIVDLGLIYNVSITKPTLNTKSAKIVMTLTTPGCPLAGTIDFMVREALSSIADLDQNKLEIDLTFDPPWTVDMMSPEAKAQLGYD